MEISYLKPDSRLSGLAACDDIIEHTDILSEFVAAFVQNVTFLDMVKSIVILVRSKSMYSISIV